VIVEGVLISVTSLLSPVTIKHSATNNQKADELLPEYTFNEVHEVHVKASVEKAKQILQTTGVKDIPAAHLLMKIRGIANEALQQRAMFVRIRFLHPISIFLLYRPTNGLRE